MGRGKKKTKTDSLRHLTFVSCNRFLFFSVTLEDLNFFIMSIWLRLVFMPHYISPSLRSFCLLKVAHLFDCVSLTVLSGLLGDLDSALSVISLSILFPSSLYSLRVSLGILFSSLLGISLSSSSDPLSPLYCVVCFSLSLLPFLP